jgi:hypothetical protein
MATATRQRVTRTARLAWVPLSEMKVAEAAQRDYRPYRVKELITDFNPEQMGYPTVSHRQDGSWHVIDGQHRIRALQEWLGGDGHWESQHIQCQVYDNLSLQEEAEMFLLLNDVLSVSTYDKFMIGVTAGRPMENEVMKIVESHHLAISRSKKEHGDVLGTIQAVSALTKTYERGGPEALGRTIRVAWEAYGQAGMDSLILSGLGLLVSRHPQVDDMDLAAKLRHKLGPVPLNMSANEIHARMRTSKENCVAAAAVQLYNKKTPARRAKLPSWWNTDETEGE